MNTTKDLSERQDLDNTSDSDDDVDDGSDIQDIAAKEKDDGSNQLKDPRKKEDEEIEKKSKIERNTGILNMMFYALWITDSGIVSLSYGCV